MRDVAAAHDPDSDLGRPLTDDMIAGQHTVTSSRSRVDSTAWRFRLARSPPGIASRHEIVQALARHMPRIQTYEAEMERIRGLLSRARTDGGTTAGDRPGSARRQLLGPPWHRTQGERTAALHEDCRHRRHRADRREGRRQAHRARPRGRSGITQARDRTRSPARVSRRPSTARRSSSMCRTRRTSSTRRLLTSSRRPRATCSLRHGTPSLGTSSRCRWSARRTSRRVVIRRRRPPATSSPRPPRKP